MVRETSSCQAAWAAGGRVAALQPFIHRYNWHRPHSALNHQARMSHIPAVNNLLKLNS
jgi:transposase InsO family protein